MLTLQTKFVEYWATSRGKFFTIAIVIFLIPLTIAFGYVGLITILLVGAFLYILSNISDLMVGVVWFIGGLLLTIISYIYTINEGTYVLFWGAIAYGLYRILSSSDNI